MKKKLLLINIPLLGICYSLDLFEAGSRYGQTIGILHPPGLTVLGLPVFVLLLLLFGIQLFFNWDIAKARGFFILGAATIAPTLLVILLSILGMMVHASSPEPFTYIDGIRHLCALIAFVLYVLCGWITHRENRRFKNK